MIYLKSYGYQIDHNLIKYNSSIRSKSDIIKLLISIIKYLNIVAPKEYESMIAGGPGNIILILHIDKMSRIFVSENNKIHTFHFPFNLIVLGGKMKVYYNGIEIDNGILSLLTATFRELDDWQSIERIIESYWDAIDDFDISAAEAQIYNGLITFLLSFETGYLRFDHDEENAHNKPFHPINHLDIYYTNKTKFKVGLQNKIDHVQLIDILNISTPCMTLR